MPPLNLLIKPASSLCNMKCKYCFYNSIAENRLTKSYGIMSSDLLEKLIERAFQYVEGFCTFAFQGGEPTLAGLDFSEKFVRYVNKYNVNKVKIQYAIQTNGISIDQSWTDFFSANNFLVGISLDGPRDIHDGFRQNKSGKGSFDKVMKAIELFNRSNVQYNILCVVHALTARHSQKIFNFYKRNHFRYLQFIPCIDPLGQKPGENNYSLTPEMYAHFLNTIFDAWYSEITSGHPISIRYFDNLAGMLIGYPPESCGMSGICTAYFVIEADGSVYPCDFYATDEWRLGNINEEGFHELIKTEAAERFVETSRYIDPSCRVCTYYSLCRGGCRRFREPFSCNLPALNYYCSSYKAFFRYAGDRLKKIAHMYSAMRF